MPHVPALYAYLFFVACMLAGEFWPRRDNVQPWYRRWLTNLSLHILIIPVGHVLAAGGVFALVLWARANGAGILPRLELPPAAGFVVTFLAFDLFGFAVHRLLHAVPWLWRFHAVHHSDVEFDATTHYRHHPLEIVITAAGQVAFVCVVGPDPLGYACASLVHQYSAIFNHANLALPSGLERALRCVVVTPDMHRIHHSARREETDSNFGNLLSCWDRLCGCYCAMPVGGQTGFELGLREYCAARELSLWGLLKGPFVHGARAAATPVPAAVGPLSNES